MNSDNIDDIYELSPAQQGMLFHTLYDPQSGIFVEQLKFDFGGGLDLDAFELAWQKIVSRHPALRSSFHWQGLEKPLQVVHRRTKLPLVKHDWRGLSSANQQKQLDAYLKDERSGSFRLSDSPPMRLTLIQTANDAFVFIWTFHHILLDGWSSKLVLEDFTHVYEATCRGEEVQLEPVRPFKDYIVWLQQQDMGKAQEYWRRLLKDIGGPTPLNVDNTGEDFTEQEAHYGQREVQLSEPTTEALQALARQNRLTLNTIVQGLWALLLSRYSGQNDVVFGSVVSGRPAALPGVESMVGMFINVLPVRVKVPPDSQVIPWLSALQAHQVEARDFEYSSMAQIQQWSGVPAGVPLFHSIVIFENYPAAFERYRNLPGFDVPDFESETFDFADEAAEIADEIENSWGVVLEERTNYPLSLMVVPDSALRVHIYYDCRRFSDPTIVRMAGHLHRLFEALIAQSGARLADIDLLTEEEKQETLVEWNHSRRDYATDRSLCDLFEAEAARIPEATAFSCEGNELNYRELNRRANQLGHYLQTVGVGPEVLVGICLERSLDCVVALLGVLKAGGAYLPLDPSYPRERLTFMLEDSGASVLLTDQQFAGMFPASKARLVSLDTDQKNLAGRSDSNTIRTTAPEHLAYVIYTSGSTGQPKGVAVEHKQVLNRLAWMWEAYPFEQHEVCCQKTALSFVDSIWEILGPLLRGVRTVIIPDRLLRDPYALVEILADHCVTRIWVVPSLLRTILESYDDLERRLPKLRFWVASGEALPVELWQQFYKQMPESVLYNLYGTSEVWDATWYDPTGSDYVQLRVPIGRPISNVQVYVLDFQLRPQPLGVPGELHVGGVGLARGYLNRPGLTFEKFIAHPFCDDPSARLYKTGDLARYREDGNLEFLRRIDNQVKIHGFRVELEEIESVLSQHPGLGAAAVVTRQDSCGEHCLVAYVVGKPNYDGIEEQLGSMSGCEEHIAQWQQVWDETYGQATVSEDPTFNFSGFNSSYTGLAIPAEEVQEWVDQAVQKVFALRPSRALEIGCGAGLLLFRIAPCCTRYCGTDFSRASLRYIEHQLEKLNLPHVGLFHRTAEDFSGFEPGSFDTIVINSVVQYFPSVEYLVNTLESALRILQPGGAIFLGDVRSLPLLEAFHTSVELYRAPTSLPVAQLRQRVQKRMAEEEELAIDPAFFFALKEQFPQINHVQVEPKRGRYRNEFTRFRYDVVLRVGTTAAATAHYSRLDWERDQLSLSAIRKVLREAKPEALVITCIPNARLSGELKALDLLANPDGLKTVGDLRNVLAAFRGTGVDPGEILSGQDELSYAVQTHWSGTGKDGRFDLLFQRENATPSGSDDAGVPVFNIETGRCRPWKYYANVPLQGIFARTLVPQLRSYVKEKLPEYMVPATFVTLESLPLTPTGKVDRRALPEPDVTRPSLASTYVPPRTPIEEELVAIWAELLGIEGIGAYDSFFELGGHSLLGTRMLSRIREAFHLDLPLRAIFEEPTVAGLAQLVNEAQARGEKDQTPAITRRSRDAHVATLLPGGVLNQADLSKRRQAKGGEGGV